MFSIHLLPAREGDAIWVKWGHPEDPCQMIVDMGTPEAGKLIYKQLNLLPAQQRVFELLVISHIDRDHIGGAISCLIDAPPVENLEFKDIWFNGKVHLDGNPIKINGGIESFGAVQGEKFGAWLLKQPWNLAFDQYPCCRTVDEPFRRIELAGDMKVTVLGPTQDRLQQLSDTWEKELAAALEKSTPPGLEIYGENEKPAKLNTRNDLLALANLNTDKMDESHANGSSIVLLLEYKQKKVVLAGDAYPDDLVSALKYYFGERPIEIDAFKLPHHSSKKNITQKLVNAVDCPNWLISTDGARYKHPDKEAIARIIAHSLNTEKNLYFNVESSFNHWWNNPEWQTKFKYKTAYGDKQNGLVIHLID